MSLPLLCWFACSGLFTGAGHRWALWQLSVTWHGLFKVQPRYSFGAFLLHVWLISYLISLICASLARFCLLTFDIGKISKHFWLQALVTAMSRLSVLLNGSFQLLREIRGDHYPCLGMRRAESESLLESGNMVNSFCLRKTQCPEGSFCGRAFLACALDGISSLCLLSSLFFNQYLGELCFFILSLSLYFDHRALAYSPFFALNKLPACFSFN